MITIPLVRNPGTGFTSKSGFDLVVILESENLERMKQADPCEVRMDAFPAEFSLSTLQLGRILICYCNAQELAVIAGLHERADLGGIMNLLLRGFKFQPDKGDCDDPYKPI